MRIDNAAPEMYIASMDHVADAESHLMLNNRKTYYSIREVCSQTGLEPHVLRYWESEFSQLRPKKNRAGNRAYRDKDIEIIGQIKHLLYEQQFTIPGAKKRLAEVRAQRDAPQQLSRKAVLSDAVEQLKSIHSLLRS